MPGKTVWQTAATILVLVLGACHAQPRPDYEKPLPARIEVRERGWADRDSGIYLVRFDCWQPVARTWCAGKCETRVERRDAVCPARPITLTYGDGQTATVRLSPRGFARFSLGAGATDEPTRVEAEGRELATVAHPPPPPPAPPPPPTHRRTYRGIMLLADLAVIASSIALSALDAEDYATFTFGGWAIAYLAAGPLVHRHFHNEAQVGWSLARRLLFPIGGVALGLALGGAAEGDCSGEDICGLGAAAGAILGGFIGLLGAMVYDTVRARVTFTVAPLDGGAAAGLAGHF